MIIIRFVLVLPLFLYIGFCDHRTSSIALHLCTLDMLKVLLGILFRCGIDNYQILLFDNKVHNRLLLFCFAIHLDHDILELNLGLLPVHFFNIVIHFVAQLIQVLSLILAEGGLNP